MTRGEKVIAFIEKYCKVPEGMLIGKPMVMQEFQRKFILDVYDNPHTTRRGYLSMPRKNAKTATIAAILIAHIAGPEAVTNSQIVSGAMSREQAAILFDLASKIIGMSEELTTLTKIIPSKKTIVGLTRNVEYKALSAEAKTKHGLSPVLALLDEVGQIKGPKSDFISAITTSQGAYENPLLLAFSTQAPTDADLFSVWIDSQRRNPDPQVICHVYEADYEADISLPETWYKANPALGIFKSEKDVAMKCRLALSMPVYEAEFRNLDLNQRVDVNCPFVTRTVWESNNAEPDIRPGDKIYCGLDLSSVSDLTAFVMISENGDVVAKFWLPAEGLIEKSRQDVVPYDTWADQGWLDTTPGKAIEYEYIAYFMKEVFSKYDVQTVAFDRYNMRFLKPWLIQAGMDDSDIEKFVEFGQGTASMTPALRELEVRLLNAKLRLGNNPLMNMCAANAIVVGASGGRKFDKSNSRGRIDGMVALAMAVGVMPIEVEPELQPRIGWI